MWGILCIFGEARGEPYDGQVAVGNVIRNRTSRRFFSTGSIVSTVTAPHQFSWLNPSDPQRTRVLAAAWEDPALVTAARAWFESELRHVVPRDCLWYHADYVTPWWSKGTGMLYVATFGRHLFYREADPV